MAGSVDLRSLNCPNCGAPLQFVDDQAIVKCHFCGSQIERSAEAPTAADDARSLKIDLDSGRSLGGQTGQARRFVVKMRDGQPVIIEADPALAAVEQRVQASRRSVTNSTPLPAIQHQPRRSNSGGCGTAVVIVALTFILVGGILLATLPQMGSLVGAVFSGHFQDALSNLSTVGTRILAGRALILAPAANDAPPDLILMTTQYPATDGPAQNKLVGLSGTTPKLLWQSPDLGKDIDYQTPLLANATLVFTVQGARLLAFHRADGTPAWEATLADKVSLNICAGCVRLQDNRVFTFSDDGTLEIFDAATGQSQWKLRSKEASPRGLYLLDGQAAFMDRDENVRGILHIFNPVSGEERTTQPGCTLNGSTEYGDWTTPLFPTPDGKDFYIFLQLGSQTCLQRWNAKALRMVWEARAENLAGFFSNEIAPLLTTEALWVGNGDQITAVSADSGQVKPLLQDADYELTPLGVQEGVLLVQAKRTRGTTRYELWAVDVASGQVRWKFDLGEAPPVADDFGGIIDDSKPVWTWHLSADGVRVIRFKSAADNKSHALLLETLNWQTGASSGQKETPLGIETIILSAPDVLIWRNDVLWMTMESQVLAFDTASGQLTYRWP